MSRKPTIAMEEQIKIIELYTGRGWPTYLLRINNDVYEMGKYDCSSPGGVNMYAGTWESSGNQEGWKRHCEARGHKMKSIPMKIIEGWTKKGYTFEKME